MLIVWRKEEKDVDCVGREEKRRMLIVWGREEKRRMLIVWGNDEKKRLTVWEEKRREGC